MMMMITKEIQDLLMNQLVGLKLQQNHHLIVIRCMYKKLNYKFIYNYIHIIYNMNDDVYTINDDVYTNKNIYYLYYVSNNETDRRFLHNVYLEKPKPHHIIGWTPIIEDKILEDNELFIDKDEYYRSGVGNPNHNII